MLVGLANELGGDVDRWNVIRVELLVPKYPGYSRDLFRLVPVVSVLRMSVPQNQPLRLRQRWLDRPLVVPATPILLGFDIHNPQIFALRIEYFAPDADGLIPSRKLQNVHLFGLLRKKQIL